MKIWFRLIALMFSVGLLFQAAASSTDSVSAKPMAVWFYADWCTNCKLLAPKYAAARSGLEDKVQFVTLDLTDDNAKIKTRETAQTLGISRLYYANHATGWVALLDGKGNQVGELHYDQSVEDIRAALEKLAQGS
jgi:thiol-disulfide isomerase/thioredoxin